MAAVGRAPAFPNVKANDKGRRDVEEGGVFHGQALVRRVRDLAVRGHEREAAVQLFTQAYIMLYSSAIVHAASGRQVCLTSPDRHWRAGLCS